MSDRGGSFKWGLMIGAVGGALAGLFLSPGTGKQNRKLAYKKMRELKDMVDSGELQERVHNIFGNIQDESMRMYTQTREEVMKRFEQSKEMSYDDYVNLVQKSIDELRTKTNSTVDQLQRFKDSLIKEWEEAEKEYKKEK